jgi:mRNA interferase MazF
VVILTRGSTLPYMTRITVAPITSAIRGVPSEVLLGSDDGMKHPCAVNLHNLATVEKERLGRRVAQLGSQRMGEICAALAFAMGCDR